MKKKIIINFAVVVVLTAVGLFNYFYFTKPAKAAAGDYYYTTYKTIFTRESLNNHQQAGFPGHSYSSQYKDFRLIPAAYIISIKNQGGGDVATEYWIPTVPDNQTASYVTPTVSLAEINNRSFYLGTIVTETSDATGVTKNGAGGARLSVSDGHVYVPVTDDWLKTAAADATETMQTKIERFKLQYSAISAHPDICPLVEWIGSNPDDWAVSPPQGVWPTQSCFDGYANRSSNIAAAVRKLNEAGSTFDGGDQGVKNGASIFMDPVRWGVITVLN